jgi:hypothetical protein
VPFPFSQGDTVQLGVTGGGSRTCVVEGFANAWVICKGDRTITYNLANVISVTVTERELR